MTKVPFKVSRRICENSWIAKKLTAKQNTLVWKLKRKTNRKQSDFAKRLQHTKKLSIFYGNLPVRKIQHNQTYTYLDKQKSLLLTLENRLDVLLVRAHFASTLFTARQLITHGKVRVNSQAIHFPAFSVKHGDTLGIAENYREFHKVKLYKKWNTSQTSAALLLRSASHLEINYKTLSAVLLYEPCCIVTPYKIEYDFI